MVTTVTVASRPCTTCQHPSVYPLLGPWSRVMHGHRDAAQGKACSLRAAHIQLPTWKPCAKAVSDAAYRDFGRASAAAELASYFADSFGNATRIDYGTGHETTFVALLYCLVRPRCVDRLCSPCHAPERWYAQSSSCRLSELCVPMTQLLCLCASAASTMLMTAHSSMMPTVRPTQQCCCCDRQGSAR